MVRVFRSCNYAGQETAEPRDRFRHRLANGRGPEKHLAPKAIHYMRPAGPPSRASSAAPRRCADANLPVVAHRRVAIKRRYWTFAGSDEGGCRAGRSAR